MFLKELTTNEKKAFLELAHLVASANGVIEAEEKKMIEMYDLEMGLDLTLEDLKEGDLEALVTVFESDRAKKIAFIEAIAIAFADGVYHDEEKKVIAELRKLFGFSEELYEEAKAWIKKANELHAEGQALLVK